MGMETGLYKRTWFFKNIKQYSKSLVKNSYIILFETLVFKFFIYNISNILKIVSLTIM